eukprot:5790147-Lingulodinium_polyedra.AAC.1
MASNAPDARTGLAEPTQETHKPAPDLHPAPRPLEYGRRPEGALHGNDRPNTNAPSPAGRRP